MSKLIVDTLKRASYGFGFGIGVGATFKIISINKSNNQARSKDKLEKIPFKDNKNTNYTKSDKIEVTADIYN